MTESQADLVESGRDLHFLGLFKGVGHEHLARDGAPRLVGVRHARLAQERLDLHVVQKHAAVQNRVRAQADHTQGLVFVLPVLGAQREIHLVALVTSHQVQVAERFALKHQPITGKCGCDLRLAQPAPQLERPRQHAFDTGVAQLRQVLEREAAQRPGRLHLIRIGVPAAAGGQVHRRPADRQLVEMRHVPGQPPHSLDEAQRLVLEADIADANIPTPLARLALGQDQVQGAGQVPVQEDGRLGVTKLQADKFQGTLQRLPVQRPAVDGDGVQMGIRLQTEVHIESRALARSVEHAAPYPQGVPVELEREADIPPPHPRQLQPAHGQLAVDVRETPLEMQAAGEFRLAVNLNHVELGFQFVRQPGDARQQTLRLLFGRHPDAHGIHPHLAVPHPSLALDEHAFAQRVVQLEADFAVVQGQPPLDEFGPIEMHLGWELHRHAGDHAVPPDFR